MKDHILSAYLDQFITENGLETEDVSRAFEFFALHCVVAKHYPDSFEAEDLSLGGNGDLGIDGLAILVNDHLVFSESDVDHFRKLLRRVDATFVFVQAKTSAKFDSAEIGNFISGVRDFFSPELRSDANEQVKIARDIKDHVYGASVDMERSPICQLYYVTTGTWNDDAPLVNRINQGLSDLRSTDLFSDVQFIPVDASGLKRIYREFHHKIVREMVFEKHTILPQISGVKEAYIGIVPCTEYLKLICDTDGALNRRLFYDNVRDFQGRNPVNREIESTVKDSARNDRFALLNNGVTVVARDVNKVGATFKLQDFQIVNGCQTSHILYLNRSDLTEKVFLPLKLIITDDNEVTNQIIQGTNRQTEVKIEAFESLAPFQKSLEEFYEATGRQIKEPVYYERRSKQYDHLEIRRERIITLSAQVQCFLAMFLNEPHSTHRYYGELLAANKDRIFNATHSPWPYYIAGMSLASLERLFSSGRLARGWRASKYQILMVFRVQSQAFELPGLSSKKIQQYCEQFNTLLRDDLATFDAFKKAGELVSQVNTELSPWREPPQRTRAFTLSLLERAVVPITGEVSGARVFGTLAKYNRAGDFGFVRTDTGVDVYVRLSDLARIGAKEIELGQRFILTIIDTPKGLRAVDVELPT